MSERKRGVCFHCDQKLFSLEVIQEEGNNDSIGEECIEVVGEIKETTDLLKFHCKLEN